MPFMSFLKRVCTYLNSYLHAPFHVTPAQNISKKKICCYETSIKNKTNSNRAKFTSFGGVCDK